MPDKLVSSKRPISKTRLSAALSASWGRVSNGLSKGVFAERMEVDVVTINRALAGPSLPAAEHLLNSLAADATALQEVLALYGLKAVPITADAANDMDLVTDLSRTVAEYLARIADGKRCHIDTAVLANLFRPIIPQMQAIVDESDRAKGVAA